MFFTAKSYAGATGFEPAVYPVTGDRVNQATPRAHMRVTIYYYENQQNSNPPKPAVGIEPTT